MNYSNGGFLCLDFSEAGLSITEPQSGSPTDIKNVPNLVKAIKSIKNTNKPIFIANMEMEGGVLKGGFAVVQLFKSVDIFFDKYSIRINDTDDGVLISL